MKKIIPIIILSIMLPISYAYAEDTTNVSDVLGEESSQTVTTTSIAEEEVLEDGDIKLKMPSQTDNPSYIITFADPSEEEVGIQLEIDGDRYVEIESPYTLPALGIGSHTLKFKYTDNEGAEQVLERTLIVIPRPPIFNSPVISDTSVELSGTGLAGSELLLTISTGYKTYQYKTDISDTGEWEYAFEEDISDGTYSAQGITRKYGYASNFSDVLTFQIGDIQAVSTDTHKDIYFRFKDLDVDTLKSLFSTNWELSVLLFSVLVIGSFLGIAFNSFVKNKKENNFLGKFREKINDGKKDDGITLRELFEKENGKKQRETKEEKIEEKAEMVKEEKSETKENEDEKKEEPETKVVSKNDFLEVYKDFDPDKDSGEEKKTKKKFSISLISKRSK